MYHSTGTASGFALIKFVPILHLQRNLCTVKCSWDLNQFYCHENSDIHMQKGTFKYIAVNFFLS